MTGETGCNISLKIGSRVSGKLTEVRHEVEKRLKPNPPCVLVLLNSQVMSVKSINILEIKAMQMRYYREFFFPST